MSFIEFIRSKGFTTKSLAEASGVSVRTLENYTRNSCRYKWGNCRLSIAVPVAAALEIHSVDLLKFDGGEENGLQRAD